MTVILYCLCIALFSWAVYEADRRDKAERRARYYRTGVRILTRRLQRRHPDLFDQEMM